MGEHGCSLYLSKVNGEVMLCRLGPTPSLLQGEARDLKRYNILPPSRLPIFEIDHARACRRVGQSTLGLER
jgi:hypothetical protein